MRKMGITRGGMAITAAALMALASTSARADDDEKARAAIAAAKAKIEDATRQDKPAAEYITQARAALDRATSRLHDGDEDRAMHAGNEAAAYAELALASAELKAAEAQRDKLRSELVPAPSR